MKKAVVIGAVALACAHVGFAGVLTGKIAEKCTIVKEDTFYGFNRTVFMFKDCKAWIVEPSVPALESKPWTWTMQWADAFVPRTPALHLLRQGWYHVTIDTFKYRMNEEGLAISKAYRDFLVHVLGFRPTACLIGMSWGGFFSTRFAARYPNDVAAIYYDCPLMTFDKFMDKPAEEVRKAIAGWTENMPAKWSDDPRMPVNMAKAVARAGIPVYLLYGGCDRVVPPEMNCEVFVPRFKAAGGEITVMRRDLYGHHPHGVEVDDVTLAEFFKKTL